MDLSTWTKGIYLLTSIFGVGVTAIDMLGILGSDDSEADADVDLGDADGFDLDLDDVDASGPIDGEVSTDVGVADATEADGSLIVSNSNGEGQMSVAEIPASGQPSTVFATSFVILTYLRRLVYFSLGFGPVGLAALSNGATTWTSLLWAVPCGIASAMLAGWIFSFQRRDVDSSVTGRDLFFQKAIVLVPISRGGMGKVRVAIGQSVVDRYAKALQPESSFAKGEEVCITKVTKECVYVEPFSAEISSGRS